MSLTTSAANTERAIVASETVLPYSEYFPTYAKLKKEVHDAEYIEELARGVDLVKKKYSDNLLDLNTMAIASGFYNGMLGKVQLEQDQYTTNYIAIAIPLDNSKDAITVSYDETVSGYFYNWYMVDDNDNIITEMAGNTQSGEIIVEIPDGAKVLKTSFLSRNAVPIESIKLMANYGDTARPYVDYGYWYEIDGIKLDLGGTDEPTEPTEPTESIKILTLPRRFNLVVGDTFEMFYKGITNVLDTNGYDYEISFSDGASRGKAWKRNYEWTPTTVTDIGTKTMTVVVRDNTGKEIDRGSVDLVVSDTPISPVSEKVICCVGDSLTEGGKWCAELLRRLTSTDGTPEGYGLNNINFIGTQERAGCKYEGYGGWTFDDYLSESSIDNIAYYIYGTFNKTDNDQHAIYNDSNGTTWKLETIGASAIKVIRVSSARNELPSSGTLTWISGGVNTDNIVYTSSAKAAGNPFWGAKDGVETNNFSAYAERMGVSSIDHMIILLGWNSVHETEATYKPKVRAFIDGVRADFPNCKITLLGIQVPSRDGFANNYGIGWKYYAKLQHVWNLNKWYQDIADEYEGVEFVNIAGQFDTEYNCLTMAKKPNIRSAIDITVQSNGVHPATEGYYQIADAVLRNIVSRLN